MEMQMFAAARDPAEAESNLISIVGSYITDVLLQDGEQRRLHKEQCAEQLQLHGDDEAQAEYADQAILANLDWGIDALDKAICTSHHETKNALLEQAHKMLQVCALLDTRSSTAGVPNTYLSAWAHLHLAFVCKLRDDDNKATVHMMEMFLIDPLYARINFAPHLWEILFDSHLTSIHAWYSEYCNKIQSASSNSNTVEELSSELAVQQLQQLKNLYEDSLDDHTRRYARCYRDWLNPEVTRKWATFLLPIVEAPICTLLFPDQENDLCEQIISPESTSLRSHLPERNESSSALEDGSFQQSRGFDGPEHSENGELHFQSFDKNSMQPVLDDDGMDSFQSRKYCSSFDLDTPDRERKDIMLNLQHIKGKSKLSRPTDQQEQTIEEASIFRRSLRTMAESKELEGSIQSSNASSPSSSFDNGLLHESSEMEESFDRSAKVKAARTEVRVDALRKYPSIKEQTRANVKSMAKARFFGRSKSSSMLGSGRHSGELEKATFIARAPKDFICPITSQLFSDPVTLETGQTYERKAIQEWLNRGNTTCPITRQSLRINVLPKTNYVLKRLVASWKEQHVDLSQEFSSESFGPQTPTASLPFLELPEKQGFKGDSPQGSPKSISSCCSMNAKSAPKETMCSSLESPEVPQSLAGLVSELKKTILSLCNSEDLHECEESVSEVGTIWSESKGHSSIEWYLTKKEVISSLVDILASSQSMEVCHTIINLFSALIKKNENIRAIIVSASPSMDCILNPLKTGIMQTLSLLYQLKLPLSELLKLDLIFDVTKALKIYSKKDNFTDEHVMVVHPMTAALSLMCQLVSGNHSNKRSPNAQAILTTGLLPTVIKCVEGDHFEERLSAVAILCSCMQVDGGCRNLIAAETDLASVLDLLHGDNNMARGFAVCFLSEIVKLSRRTLNNRILNDIKGGGTLSSRHMLLAYLQSAPPKQRALTAGLLLQIDLLEEPRKSSIYRDEAVDALLEILKSKGSSESQVAAAETLVASVGIFSSSGKPLTESLLLKVVDLAKSKSQLSEGLQSDEWRETKEEEISAREWERRVAKALMAFENGAIFEVLRKTVQSNDTELSKPSMVTAVWLSRMMQLLPDTGLRAVASRALVDPFIGILVCSKNVQDQALAALGLHSFLDNTGSIQILARDAEQIIVPLRKLQKLTWVSKQIIRAIVKAFPTNAADIWAHEDVGRIELAISGGIRALVRTEGRIFSGHSDGTIKVWHERTRLPAFIHEIKKHNRSITSLAISHTTERLHSGSADRSIRIWTLGPDEIQCVQLIDLNDAVHGLLVAGIMTCVIPQGTGVKVQYENGASKVLNGSKHIQSIHYHNGKIYCGCIDSSIQELDVADSSILTIQAGTRTLMGKKPIYALQVWNKQIFAAGSPVDGVSMKVFNQTDKSLVGSVSTAAEVRTMVVNDDFIYLGTSSGVIEVWLTESLARVEVLNVGSRINCLLLNGDTLYAGSEDGKLSVFSSP
ncbi:hypothetical protein O6H91_04G031600 [Diphasiastrum complanatum]|uniref:Uncharacterized protein n=1 Tax=Diphasiastrum complanatum TaxID=34168 RepID=A0ACC2DVP2_DIPCM|nr:hypothetical protein O6H91_04G031600 [Diphasiastrum complanatum]